MDRLDVNELHERSQTSGLYNEATRKIDAIRLQLDSYDANINKALDMDIPLIQQSRLQSANEGLTNALQSLKIWNDDPEKK